MRRITSAPYCHLETIKPVKHKCYNARFQRVTVVKRYRFEQWHIAKDLAELIRKYDYDIKQHGWKSNPGKGTVNGVAMRRIESKQFQPEQFTAKELKAPSGYRYWKCDPDAKTVTLLCMSDYDMRDLSKNRRLWRNITSDSRYLPPLIVPMPDGWVVTYSLSTERDGSISKTPEVSGYLEDRCGSAAPTFEQAFSKLIERLDSPAVWKLEQVFGWPEQRELTSLVFRRRKPGTPKDAKFWSITGKTFEDVQSPKVLYRAMHYFGVAALDELYKGNLMRIWHPKGIAWADLGTWKCEMEIRLCAAAAICKQLKAPACVRAGAPGSQSDEVSAPKEVMEWYNLLVRLLETKTMIYSGNKFEV